MAPKTILVIDEAADHSDVLSRCLQLAGYRVIATQPGSEAVHVARSERPDLILTALSLPGQLAWETTRQLCADPVLAKTPVLGTTVYSTLLSVSRVQALGCADLLPKPFDFEMLLDNVGRWLTPLISAA